MVTEVFRSPELAVRAVCEFGSPECVITFDSYSDERSLDRRGFGADFLYGRSIDAIHFIGRENDWYQYPALPAVAARVARFVEGYQRVVAYGSSMGAYAAIRFGGLVGAQVALAISPQFSIDPQRARFERRWKYDSERIDFTLERTLRAPFVSTACIVYDPNDADRRHVELFRRHTRVVDVLLPDVGHPATGPIAEAGLLEELAMDFIYERLDIQRFARRVLREHLAGPHHHYVLSQRAKLARTRIAHAGEAAALAPDNFGYVSHHASLLTAAGRFEEAQAAFARAATLMPDHPVLLFKLTEFHERRGDLDRAIGLAYELVTRHSQTFQPRLDQLQARRRRELGWMNVVKRVSSRLGLRRRLQATNHPVPAETAAEPPPAARLDGPTTSWRLESADGLGASSTSSQTVASPPPEPPVHSSLERG